MLQVTFSKSGSGKKKTASVKVMRVEGPEYYIERYFRYNVNDPDSFNQAMQKARQYVAENKQLVSSV